MVCERIFEFPIRVGSLCRRTAGCQAAERHDRRRLASTDFNRPHRFPRRRALYMTIAEMDDKIGDLPQDGEIVVYCT